MQTYAAGRLCVKTACTQGIAGHTVACELPACPPHITHAFVAVRCLPVCDPDCRRAPPAAEEVAGSGG